MFNKNNTDLPKEKSLENAKEQPQIKAQECAQEWALLQNQFDSYEKFSLLIKLVNIVLTVFIVLNVISINNNFNAYLLPIPLILWLQDAVWKTFQTRIETRILQLETAIESQESLTAFQFNRQFLKTRASGLSIIIEYFKSAIRPTIAFPHCLLALVLFGMWF